MLKENNVEIKIESAIVIQRSCGTDRVLLYTNLPASAWPWNENAALTLDCAKGTGLDYVRTVLGIEPELVKS